MPDGGSIPPVSTDARSLMLVPMPLAAGYFSTMLSKVHVALAMTAVDVSRNPS